MTTEPVEDTGVEVEAGGGEEVKDVEAGEISKALGLGEKVLNLGFIC